MGSLHVLWPQDRKIPYANPKEFRKIHVRAPYGFLWISYGLENMIMYAGTVRARADAINGFSAYLFGNIRMIIRAEPYRARWGPWRHLRVIFTRWLCVICPVGASTAPAKRSTGLLPTKNRRKTVRVWKYGARTGPDIFETSCASTRHTVWLPTGSRTARELQVTKA